MVAGLGGLGSIAAYYLTAAGVGYLKLFGSERAGAGVRVEAGYRHEKYGESIIGDIIYPEGSRNHARLDVGLTFYLH